MDFIETWLGFSPDGGDGSLELLLLTCAAAAAAGIWAWRAQRRKGIPERRARGA